MTADGTRRSQQVTRPRHARKEIRAFADELDRGGWAFQSVDASGHTIWAHPRATATYKLPETPRHFDVQRARREVARLLGQRVAGKRNGKAKAKPERRDFALQAAQKSAGQRPPTTLDAVRAARARRASATDIRATERAERQRRYYESLMQPEFGGRGR